MPELKNTHQLERRAAPRGRRASTGGAALHVRGHRHRHGAGGIGIAQAVVVHHVVGHVVEQAGLEGLQGAEFQPGLLEAQAGVAAVILDVVFGLGGNIIRQHKPVYIGVMMLAFLANSIFNINVIFIILTCAVFGVLLEVIHHMKRRGDAV